MFFVTDFETSSLTPWDEGEPRPLTVGIVPVTLAGDILTEETFYARFPIYNFPDWHMPGNLTDTERFWLGVKNEDEAGEEVFNEAWLRELETQEDYYDVMERLTEYIDAFGTPGENFIVANPGHFDFMWMQWVYAFTGLKSPFHYRVLCLRSMKYGLDYGNDPTFGSARGKQSAHPHHALYDAIAEAEDLVDLMVQSRGMWGSYHEAKFGANH
jgi:hypothetical protein